MFCLSGHADEHSRKHSEHICLDECHEQFKAVHEYSEKHGYTCHGPVDHRTEFDRHEYHGHKSENHRMFDVNRNVIISRNEFAFA